MIKALIIIGILLTSTISFADKEDEECGIVKEIRTGNNSFGYVTFTNKKEVTIEFDGWKDSSPGLAATSMNLAVQSMVHGLQFCFDTRSVRRARLTK